jgi:hypothetical protein
MNFTEEQIRFMTEDQLFIRIGKLTYEMNLPYMELISIKAMKFQIQEQQNKFICELARRGVKI